MSHYTADLHIHSRYSRATSKALSIHRLAAWGCAKGLDVLATGDFTHPGWLREIESALEEDGSGLLRIKDPAALASEIPWLESGARPPLFMLGTEISSIYKSQGVVRKVHNLVYLSSLENVRTFNRRLGQVGNLESDGRPILGLDSRDLLEMVLETDPWGFLIPAHIWTPWFALFGSKSGFDRLEDCFRDLSPHIFALETGLSSDPEMNWLWSELDPYTLVSNSDAHSGEKLGREANLFQGSPSYENIFQALRGTSSSQRFLGSVEFFPEEGKYHLDGHRKCKVVLDPKKTAEKQGVCPVCGGQLTVGVLNRVMRLADREDPIRPDRAPGFSSLIPLPEVLSELLGKGPKTKAVNTVYARLIRRFESELNVLMQVPAESLRSESPALAEGIARMRRKEVFRQPGYDGEFGRISVFTPKERQRFTRGRSLWSSPSPPASPAWEQTGENPDSSIPDADSAPEILRPSLNPEQLLAVRSGPHPVLVVAGPGTGKTKTLIGRIRRLLQDGIAPEQILILTFTRAAARELRERLQEGSEPARALPRADTLHALAFEHWRQDTGRTPVLISEQEAREIFSRSNPELRGRALSSAWERLTKGRETRTVPADLETALDAFSASKTAWGVVEYIDLLEAWLEQIGRGQHPGPYTHVLVDEIQDLSALQGEIIRGLLPESGEGFFGIGDPDQSIYGFRGAMGDVASNFGRHWPSLQTITLTSNYRSSQDILDLSAGLCPNAPGLKAMSAFPDTSLTWYQAHSAVQEAHCIAIRIRDLIGGTGHSEADRGEVGHLSPGDIAVLVRFKALLPPIEQALHRHGVPCAVPERAPFWHDERVKLIVRTAAQHLGRTFDSKQEVLDCPASVLAEGPQALSSTVADSRLDHAFWSSQAFTDLARAYAEHGGWAELLAWIGLETDAASIRQKAQKVRLLTLHAAKGLEFEAVFLPALEEGILPFAGPGLWAGRPQTDSPDVDRAEERRLFYVGLTRAKQMLFMSCAAHRTVGRRQLRLPQSSFLQELDLRLVRKIQSVARTTRQERQLSLLSSIK